MLTEPQRQTILERHQKGMGIRQISRTLGHARHTVRRVLSEGHSTPPHPTTGVPPALSSRLPELFCTARGNVVRIQELLREQAGLEVPYSTLTSWVRQMQLREPLPPRTGHYEFAPGQEMQHDTSPHRLEIGGTVQVAQCAGLILGFSHSAFIQYDPTFTRFEAQVFPVIFSNSPTRMRRGADARTPAHALGEASSRWHGTDPGDGPGCRRA